MVRFRFRVRDKVRVMVRGLGAALLQVADDGVVQVGLRRALEHAKD